MIPRYSREKMAAIWSDQNRYQCWLNVELAALDAMVAHGLVPAEAAAEVRAKAAFEPARVEEIEAVTRHDVIAFLTNVAEHVGPSSRFVHLGMTSSDVLDTAYNLQLVQAADLLLAGLDALLAVLKRRAFEHKHTVQIGRSHGVHAEPITFGLKLAIWYDEMKRNRARLVAAREDVRVGKLSGAVGTFAHLPPTVEEQAMAALGLKPAPASSQIVQRDRHAAFFTTLAVLGGSMEKFAVEVRHLQRTEVYEAEEFFHKGQKGSSAMPHKRNPVLSENISGLCRLLRSYAVAALEDQPLWHERDISHSSVERVIGPDATIVADFALARLTNLLDKLLVYPENMIKNLNQTSGLYASQSLLLNLVRAGLTREAAYQIVQRNAMQVWEKGADFLTTLLADAELTALVDEKTIRESLDVAHQLRHVDDIFRRVFGE
ncbi:MAG: adenylosuccinate lyase [Myxococcales bacterium]|nr:adenylosuccinate lyase [Myxococcales bacterium]